MNKMGRVRDLGSLQRAECYNENQKNRFLDLQSVSVESGAKDIGFQ